MRKDFVVIWIVAIILASYLSFVSQTSTFASTEVEVGLISTPSTIKIGEWQWNKIIGKWEFKKIHSLDFQEYLKGVVPYEMFSSFKLDALKAQAVAARNYAILTRLKEKHITPGDIPIYDPDGKRVQTYHDPGGYDLCSTTHCQVWQPPEDLVDGVPNGYPDSTNRAANETKGEVVTYNNTLIDATYFSSSRNHYTKNSENVWLNYYEYSRKTMTPEDTSVGAGGHGVGMSQYGAQGLAESEVKYKDILKHYYGLVPPYVKKVKVSQGGLVYNGSWIDDDIVNDDYLHPTRHSVVETNKPLDIEADAIIEIYFSEEISSIDGTRVIIENEEASYVGWSTSDNPPLGVVKFKLTIQQLKNIGAGKHIIKIKAKHEFAQDWQLDSDPETFAYQSIDPGNLNNFIGYEPGEDMSHQISVFSTSSGIYTMDFEDGTDSAVIQSRIPGLYFTTTEGYDWIYGDRRTGQYSIPPYGDAAYECNGNFFAWLGENQGMGRIDFTGATTKSVSFAYSSEKEMYLEAYSSDGKLIDSDSGSGNLSTGRLDRLSITGTNISYVLVHDQGNRWLVDDLMVEDLLRDTTAKFLPQDFERVIEILDTINIGLPQQTDFANSTPQIMKIILNWGGSEMKLEVYKPDGTPYGQWQSSNPPIIVDISNAETGKWKLVTTAENIPHNDYPFALVVGTKQVPSHTISFNSGWNLVSIPIQLPDNTLDKVLQPIAGHYQSVWTYENNEWKWYIENAPSSFNDLDTIEPGKGYWINMKDESKLTLMGDQITNAVIPLRAGWNLVGFNSLMAKPIEEALSSITNAYQSVWTYDIEWKRYTPNSGDNSLERMEPGKGYWINAKADCMWDISKTTQTLPMVLESIQGDVSSDIPEIPFVIWGNVSFDGMSMTSGEVLLTVDNKIQSTYQLGSVKRYEDFYVLEIPVTNSSKQAIIYVQINDTMMKAVPVPTGIPGQLIQLDLAVRRIPLVSLLHQNYPNPFNSGTWIPYQLKADSDVVVNIYASTGQLVRTLNMGYKLSGFYTNKEKAVYWDGKNETTESVVSGIYFYNIRAGNLTTTKKMVITNRK